MAYLSKITLPSGTTYDIKDAEARQAIAGGITYIGVSSTAITDGGSQQPTIGGQVVTPANGNLCIYDSAEFLFTGTYGDGGAWSEFGDMSTLGDMAYVDTASASYTPVGSVSLTNENKTPSISASTGTSEDKTFQCSGSVGAPNISLDSAGATGSFATGLNAVAPGGTAPSNPITYYSVTGETLSLYQIGYNTGDAKTGDASYTADAPSFTGGYVKLANGSIGVPTSASFSGTAATIQVSPDSE